MVVCIMPKGAGAPAFDSRGEPILGTTRVHKTPLTVPGSDIGEFELLKRWLAGYRPDRLFRGGVPTDAVHWPRPAFNVPDRPGDYSSAGCANRQAVADLPSPSTFSQAVSEVLRYHAGADFRVFSPDELSSNRVDAHAASACNPCVEVLNESMCHLWLQGYLESGRRGLFITYEAFATVTLSLLRQYAKTRALADRSGREQPASLVYLITSLGWTNNYSHQDPAIYGALLDTALDATHVLLPADPIRLAATLDSSLRSRGGIHLISASKTAGRSYPTETIADELADGLAIWPDLSDAGEPDLVLCGAGDVATDALLGALEQVRPQHPGVAVRYVCLHDLAVLNPRSPGGSRLTDIRIGELFAGTCPVVFAVPGYASTVKAMLFDRPQLAGRSSVVGYADPGDVVSHSELLQHTGMSGDRLVKHLSERIVR